MLYKNSILLDKNVLSMKLSPNCYRTPCIKSKYMGRANFSSSTVRRIVIGA